jgi:hypothetical protein
MTDGNGEERRIVPYEPKREREDEWNTSRAKEADVKKSGFQRLRGFFSQAREEGAKAYTTKRKTLKGRSYGQPAGHPAEPRERGSFFKRKPTQTVEYTPPSEETPESYRGRTVKIKGSMKDGKLHTGFFSPSPQRQWEKEIMRQEHKKGRRYGMMKGAFYGGYYEGKRQSGYAQSKGGPSPRPRGGGGRVGTIHQGSMNMLEMFTGGGGGGGGRGHAEPTILGMPVFPEQHKPYKPRPRQQRGGGINITVHVPRQQPRRQSSNGRRRRRREPDPFGGLL